MQKKKKKMSSVSFVTLPMLYCLTVIDGIVDTTYSSVFYLTRLLTNDNDLICKVASDYSCEISAMCAITERRAERFPLRSAGPET